MSDFFWTAMFFGALGIVVTMAIYENLVLPKIREVHEQDIKRARDQGYTAASTGGGDRRKRIAAATVVIAAGTDAARVAGLSKLRSASFAKEIA